MKTYVFIYIYNISHQSQRLYCFIALSSDRPEAFSRSTVRNLEFHGGQWLVHKMIQKIDELSAAMRRNVVRGFRKSINRAGMHVKDLHCAHILPCS